LCFIVLIYSLLYNTNAAGTCSAFITANARHGSAWVYEGIPFQLYDITAANTGSCPITSLFGLFGFNSSGSITQEWNYDQTTGEITSFGSALEPANSFVNAGFVLAGGVTPTLAFTTPKCDPSCLGTTPLTGSTSTIGSATTSSTTSGSETSCTTTQCLPSQICIVATTGPTCFFRSCSEISCTSSQVCISDGGVARCINVAVSCNVLVSVIARANTSFVANSVHSQIYDLDISNIGGATVSNLVIEIVPVAGTQVLQNNKWNLEQGEGNLYTVATYGMLTADPTGHYLGAGFVLSGANSSVSTPSVFPYSVTC